MSLWRFRKLSPHIRICYCNEVHRSGPKFLQFLIDCINGRSTAVRNCYGGISVRNQIRVVAAVVMLLTRLDNFQRSFRARPGSSYIFYVRV